MVADASGYKPKPYRAYIMKDVVREIHPQIFFRNSVRFCVSYVIFVRIADTFNDRKNVRDTSLFQTCNIF